MKNALKTYEPVLGFEVHVELNTATKMFSTATNAFGDQPNSNVTPGDIGLPGTLPTINAVGIDYGIKLGLALNCTIAPKSGFSRKQYFYPDLGKNYQTSQEEPAIAYDGYVDVELDDGEIFRVEIERAHIEEDAGKLTHIGSTGRIHNSSASLVDYNRAGVPLVEIVSKPITGAGERAPELARAYLATIRDIVKTLGVSDARMERGNIRCDANVSLMPIGSTTFGTRTETKNLNSFKFMEEAIELEIERQIHVLESGGAIVQETRLYNGDTKKARSMRTKEDSNDYRYFPCPDLLPVVLDEAYIDDIRRQMPELPEAKRARYVAELGLPEYDAGILSSDAATAHYFEDAARLSGQPKLAANWVMGEIAAQLNRQELSIRQCPISAADLAGLIKRLEDGTISSKMAKAVFEAMWSGEGDADTVIETKGLKQVSDSGALEKIVDEIIANNPQQVTNYRSAGEDKRPKMLGFFVGQAMKASKGQANPQELNRILLAKLGS